MNGVVIKFGGSSIATAEKIKDVARLILRHKEKYDKVIVVVSAMGDTTDHLLSLASTIAKKPSAKEVDMLLSSGEVISASLLAIHLIDKGCPAKSFTGFQAGFRTRGKHRESQIEDLNPSLVEKAINRGEIAIVAGFQGINKKGAITTLGRGGSDISAVALAARLKTECKIFTDVAGIYSADPRIRPQAKKLKTVTYEEAVEMAHLGAKVIEARSVELASKYEVPLYIALNTGTKKGTYIVGKKDLKMEDNKEILRLTNVSRITDILMININKVAKVDSKVSECFVRLAQKGINVDILNQMMIDSSHSAVSFTAAMDDKEDILKILERMKFNYTFHENVNKVSLIGSAMRHQVGVVAKSFKVFSEQKVPFYMITTSDISISYVIDEEYTNRIVNALADAFGL